MKIAKFLFCFSIALSAFTQIVQAQGSAKRFVENELLVKYKNGTASGAARSINQKFGATVVKEFAELGWQHVKLPKNLTINQAIIEYKNLADIESVQPNYYYHLLATPNDTQFTSSGMYGMAKISAPAAWDLTTGSPTVVVANIDSGMRYTHEDLAANAWKNPGEIAGNGVDDDANGFVDDVYGWDFFYNDSDPIDDAGGHGTHTAGTIGAVGNNGKGVVGVNWNVKIMAIKIFSLNGSDSTSAMLVNAYNYIRMMKNRGVNIRVTNNSYSGCNEACGYDQATKDALDAMNNAGILNVFAAGNSNRDIEIAPAFPASYTSPGVLAVASSDSSDNRSSFSNYGATSVDVAAPGSAVLSTYANSDASYATLSGTSMATPHVAGAAALLSAYNPTLSAASLKATLMNTVDVLPQWAGLVKTGGRINVSRALQNQTVCTFTLDRASQQVFPEGGTFTINVTAPNNCDYSATSSANWINITGGNTLSGNGTITFTVAFNSSLPRAGTITVGNQIFNVGQNPNEISPKRSSMDFNGDGRTDFVAIQNNNGAMLWHINQSLQGYTSASFGAFDDIAIPELFDADLRNDIAVWRPSNGTFYVLRSADNTFQAFQFGQTGDNPTITQDFDGDDRADFAVTRAVNDNLFWYINNSTGGFRAVQFGLGTDKPLRGDFDGDNQADLAVYRASNNTFYIRKSSNNQDAGLTFGDAATDKIVPADYDGDGKTDFAVWRTTNGVWYYVKSSDGKVAAVQFGATGDLPTPGDYDGDGRTDFSVWRPNANANSAGTFYVQSALSGFSAFGWGNSQMKIPANSVLNQ